MASTAQLKSPKSRLGRRPMRVDTMLKKEKEGTLYKYTKLGMRKIAEPPPPKGVPVKLWDKRLEYGPGEKVPELLSRKIDRMIKKGYKLQGHTEVQGIPVAIENRKGSVRKGKDKDGHEWRTKMKHPYGYIVGTKGADGEPVDAYVGPDKEAPKAYVVHQHKPDGTGYDEDKVMLGFKDKTEARKAFLKHYDSDKFLGPISIVTMERLRELVAAKRKMVKISTATSAFLDEMGKLAQKDTFERAALTAKPVKLPTIAKKIRTKITGPVSKTEAAESLKRLRSLEKEQATTGELARGAAVGATLVPAATMAARLIAGKKAVGKAFKGGRELAALSGTGALYGGVIPAVRHKVEKEVEKQKIKEYLGHSRRGTFRSKIKRMTGL